MFYTSRLARVRALLSTHAKRLSLFTHVDILEPYQLRFKQIIERIDQANNAEIYPSHLLFERLDNGHNPQTRTT